MRHLPTPLVVLCLACCTVALSLSHARRLEPRTGAPEARLWLLQDTALVGATGMRNQGLLSSVVWAQVIQHYASQAVHNHDSDTFPDVELLKLVDLSIAFDPRWRFPFEFSGLVFQTGQKHSDSVALRYLRLGVDRFPSAWKLRVYLAMALLEDPRGDSLAALYLQPLLLSTSEVPEYARTLAITMMTKHGAGEVAGMWLVNAIQNSPDPSLRLVFQKRLASELRKSNRDPVQGEKQAAILVAALTSSDLEERGLATGTVLSVFRSTSARTLSGP